MKAYTNILNFPTLKDFLDWLKTRGIKEIGRVIMQQFTIGEKGITFVKYGYKLSARDPERQEIIVCELPFFSGLWISKEVTEKEAAPVEEKYRAWLEERLKEFQEKEKWAFTTIHAEIKAIGEEAA